MKRLIYDKGKGFINIAETDRELTSSQFLQISRVLHSGMTFMGASLAVLKILSGISWWSFVRIPADVKLNCLEHIKWVLDKWSPSIQLLPVYKKFHGPSDELDNITLVEFNFSEAFYADYVSSTDKDDSLNGLVAVLYRVEKKGYDIRKDLDGDCRQPFNANAIKYYSIVISAWPMHVKQAILMYYDGCRKKLAQLYPEIFQNKSGEDQNSDTDMFGLIRGLAGGKYGDFEKTEQLPLHTALRELTYILAEEERIKSQTPAA